MYDAMQLLAGRSSVRVVPGGVQTPDTALAVQSSADFQTSVTQLV